MAVSSEHIAFLGIGNMGQGITKNLISKGRLREQLVLWNRTYRVAADHSTAIGHSRATSDISEAIDGSSIVWSCLSNQEAVIEVFGRALQRDVRGKLFVESSTITSQATDKICRMVEAAGADFIAMPVFGEPTMAQKGILTCVPCGKREAVDRIRPFLIGVVARAIVDLSGEQPGKASLLKLLGNTLILNTIEMIAESHVFAEKTGLGVENLQKLIETTFSGGPSMIYSRRMSSGEYSQGKPMVNAGPATELAAHVLEAARESGAHLPAYEVAVKHLTAVRDRTGATEDISGIYGVVRLESGLRYSD
ncbi:NAD(P)-binding protein [Viridothelium virens]|uniref:NAD(P)-binding protein n=1 Tax=Viridothelium virens TaxID=1048519 RepID=A0A6A6HF82_VIRVR|nr:NAD(P)-binding protein [Viridothelium virens]